MGSEHTSFSFFLAGLVSPQHDHNWVVEFQPQTEATEKIDSVPFMIFLLLLCMYMYLVTCYSTYSLSDYSSYLSSSDDVSNTALVHVIPRTSCYHHLFYPRPWHPHRLLSEVQKRSRHNALRNHIMPIYHITPHLFESCFLHLRLQWRVVLSPVHFTLWLPTCDPLHEPMP